MTILFNRLQQIKAGFAKSKSGFNTQRLPYTTQKKQSMNIESRLFGLNMQGGCMHAGRLKCFK